MGGSRPKWGGLPPTPEGTGGEFSHPLFGCAPPRSGGEFSGVWGGVGGSDFSEIFGAPPPGPGGSLGSKSLKMGGIFGEWGGVCPPQAKNFWGVFGSFQRENGQNSDFFLAAGGGQKILGWVGAGGSFRILEIQTAPPGPGGSKI